MMYMATLLAATKTKNSWVSTIVLLGVFFVLMYFLMIRPQKKKEKEQEEMRNALQKGDEIITIGGICGTVSTLKKDRIVIEIGSNKTKMEIMPWAVSKSIKKGKATAPKKEAPKGESDEDRTGKKGFKMLNKAEENKPEEEKTSEPKKDSDEK